MFKVALAQINSCVGDLGANAVKITATIERARRAGAKLVVFPELVLCGYPPEDLLLKKHFVQASRAALQRIAGQVTGITAVLGFVDGEGDKVFNAAAILADKTVQSVYHKVNLPNYGVFDEKRYFTPGTDIVYGDCAGRKFAVSICEDIWRKGFTRLLAASSLDFLVNLSASPFHLGKAYERRAVLKIAAQQAGAAVVYANLVGGQDELIFDGASMVVDARGRPKAIAKSFEEDLLICDLDRRGTVAVKALTFDEQTAQALTLGLRDYVGKNGFNRVIVGVSGGIDSAVVAALAVAALGKKRVIGLLMPSRYTSPETLRDAQTLCRNLGIRYEVVVIEDIFKTFLTALAPALAGYKPDITEENLQARIRGTLLMAFSNKLGALVINTGNKSEVSCGYCTLYGDMVGGFGVLKDLTKDAVYRLARYLNKQMGKPIPASVIRRAPSAELRPDQKDSDTLPDYKILDPLIKMYVEDDYSLEQMVQAGYDRTTVAKVIRLVDSSEYKRRQAPLGVKITPRAFGKDRRMPVTNKFRG